MPRISEHVVHNTTIHNTLPMVKGRVQTTPTRLVDTNHLVPSNNTEQEDVLVVVVVVVVDDVNGEEWDHCHRRPMLEVLRMWHWNTKHDSVGDDGWKQHDPSYSTAVASMSLGG